MRQPGDARHRRDHLTSMRRPRRQRIDFPSRGSPRTDFESSQAPLRPATSPDPLARAWRRLSPRRGSDIATACSESGGRSARASSVTAHDFSYSSRSWRSALPLSRSARQLRGRDGWSICRASSPSDCGHDLGGGTRPRMIAGGYKAIDSGRLRGLTDMGRGHHPGGHPWAAGLEFAVTRQASIGGRRCGAQSEEDRLHHLKIPVGAPAPSGAHRRQARGPGDERRYGYTVNARSPTRRPAGKCEGWDATRSEITVRDRREIVRNRLRPKSVNIREYTEGMTGNPKVRSIASTAIETEGCLAQTLRPDA